MTSPFALLSRVQRPAVLQSLHADFSRGRAPRERELLGRWILIKQVDTEQLPRETRVRELIVSDELGVRDSSAGHRFYWQLRIQSGADRRLRATSDTPWAGSEVSVLSFEKDGTMMFTKDYGGDSAYFYRCRLTVRNRLVCFRRERQPQHAVVFRRE